MTDVADRKFIPSWMTNRPARLAAVLVAPALAAVLLLGCSGGVSGTSGDEGTLDMLKVEKAAASSNNEAIAKKAKLLGGGLGQPARKK